MYTIFIRGLEVYAFHGVSSEEQAIGHRYEVDLEIEADGAACQTDQISDTSDYGTIADRVTEIVKQTRFHTLERLAFVIASTLLEEQALVTSVNVSVAKKCPPISHIASTAGVRLRLTRDQT